VSARRQPCDRATIDGRLAKARQFFEAATAIRDLADDEATVGDAFVTLCVHAGIAAADVICCRRLGYHVQGESHAEAIDELAKVSKERAKDLRVLLGMKTRAGYGDAPVSTEQRKRAIRAADRLVRAAAIV
jgi:hypothetical protein